MRRLAVCLLGALLVGCSSAAAPKSDARPAEDGERSDPAATPAPRVPGTCFDRGPGDYVDVAETADGGRSYRVHVPPGYDGNDAVPVLFNFHGQSRTAAEQETYSGLVPVSDENGFILVSPEGGFGQWNIVGVYAEDGVDDVGAVAAILDQVESQFCVDDARVFATGLSNGAQMASQVACLLPGRFAGIAPVAGIEFQGCDGPPVAVITFHGTDDYNVPYDAIPGNVAAWVAYDQCPDLPESDRIGESVVREAYFGCEGQPVVFYTLEGGGHTWPGAESDSGGVGPTNREIKASELIWEFFENVRRR